MRYAPFAVIAAALAAPAPAGEPGEQRHGDWIAAARAEDTGEDLRVTCRIGTADDGAARLNAEIASGDALPPHGWPAITLIERAPDGGETQLRDGDRLLLTFNNGVTLAMEARTDLDASGATIAVAAIDPRFAATALTAMRWSGTAVAWRGDEALHRFSLSGFTAAYRRMAEACGFSAADVAG